MDYLDINRQSWNQRTDVHVNSEFYDNPSFIAGRNSLNDIELPLLGDLTGKRVLHLMCHFGQDTISMQRMGAKATGIDLSDHAIREATKLNEACGTETRFVRSDLYGLPDAEALKGEQFDVIFSSYGTVGWLPDISRWAKVVSHFLKPGGRFVFAEFHPVVWMFDDAFSKVAYDYFNSDPIVENDMGTYTDGDDGLKATSISWNHGLAEVMNALMDEGMKIEAFKEVDYSPYSCFENTVEFEPGKFRIASLEKRIPMVYALRAVKEK